MPIGPDSPLLTDDFERFLDGRQAWLWQQIQAATGLSAPSDLEAPATEVQA
jgi:hypothetical protein